MTSIKHISRIAGTLIILGMIAGILSIVPSVEGESYLKEVYPNKNQVLSGALFQFLLVPIYIGFSLVIYPVLRDFSRPLSIGFVGFRFVAGAFQLVGLILLPAFILISQKYTSDSGSNIVLYETIGEMLKLLRDLINHLGVMVATGLGGLILYALFFMGKQIPRWLSVWGIAGNTLLLVASFLLLFQLLDVVSIGYGMMTIPVVLQEIVFAIWLLTKGLCWPLKDQNLEYEVTRD
ncbi:hypothetical protein KS4_07510 [Poriferisphaera corsica]|uniref:DUF4386 domain-containing protein n=1 Tax=Poriferisphaera corsica TaxID=2528020 RepID=A0A517YR63_9BACT|nr:DUF4386 domain-containing protein [Poriferisphaera corsica]QDU32717.1 hypothetical protein KS4_07510 [Poriferisphaera corsica]